MAKGKSSNPMDAARKAARKRELKRNKEERAKVREVATVKKDTRSLEADIRRLESKDGGALSQVEREELGQLKAEVRRIREAKEAYVKEHPEHRKFVFAREMEEEEESKRKQKEGKEAEERNRDAKRPWEGRDPRWSQDYDPVFNPLGAPPPGMPYREKTKEQFEAEYGVEDESAEEDDSDSDDDDDDDGDDIVMPDGPPPLPQEEDEGDSDADSDGIVMPEGPPPGAPPSGPKAMTAQPPLPPGPPPPPQGPALAYGRPFRPTYQPHHHPRPPPPPGFGNNVPYGAPQGMPYIGGPPPPGFGGLPPRPPPRPYAASARPPVAPPGPPPQRPPATISVAPKLRDLKKEATAFVPPALRRKQAAERARAKAGGLSRIDAAPSSGADDDGTGEGDSSSSTPAKVGLMDALRPHLSAGAAGGGRKEESGGPVDKSQDDYQKFLGDINDLL
ncbi:hypothetical protein FA10DRAFT_284220 [Acaromyces ingoldii]|uniref:Wbp11/ELF5/Saf1 N-terminal domain-containing protein n=1 Tax=Acaromyces ingoldii TaxID=215250 RepID=A0A316YU83_9BASI|nr:hypothetical protein FA10DRAFT_284220 [Acaromyces ingoldii]PWN91275.1 hypothetical protein FA10DRAFT_284220 [Acaromyces ingoldii]